MKKISLFLFLCWIPFSLIASETVRIYGYVYTAAKREPAVGASIQVRNTSIGTIVRHDGYYELSFPVTDTASVSFSYIGFETYILPVSTDNPNMREIVYLQEDAVMMDDLTVRGIERSSTTTQHIDISGNIPGTAGIENVLIKAGVSTANELSSQYSVRGGNYDENSVYVNNIEVYRPMLVQSGQQEGLSFINPDLVESVAFSAGGFEPKYGDKMASVLDIRYKKPKSFEGSVSASLLGASAYIGQASKDQKFTQIHGIRYKSSNYILGDLDSEGVFNQQFVDYQGYLTYQFAPKWEASVLGNFSRNSYHSVPESLSTTFGTLETPYNLTMYFDGQEKDLFQTVFGAGTITYKPVKKVNLSIIGSAFSSHENVNYDILGEYWLKEVGADGTEGIVIGTGADQNYARDKLHTIVQNISHRGDYSTLKNKLEWGIGIQHERISDEINEFQVRDSSGYSLPYAPGEMNVWYNLYSENTLDSYRTQGFIQDSYRIFVGEKKSIITLTGGVRAAYWTFNEEFIVSPRATIAYFPRWKHEFTFRFSTGLYYQSPFYKEVRDTVTDNMRNVTVVLNENIKSQRSVHFVLGSDYFFKMNHRPFKFTTEIFYKPADQVISYNVDNVKVIYAGENNAKAYAAGVDFKLFGELVPGTDSWVNLTFMRAKEDIYGDGVGYVPRPNDQRFNFSMFFQDYFPMFPKFKFHLRAIYADGLPFWAPNVTTHTNQNTNRSKAYRRIDIGVTRAYVKGDVAWLDKTQVFSALKSINLGVEILNLLDTRNVASYYWVTDAYNIQHAIPNQLSGMMFNAKISLNF
jgi:hypothetical protein